MITLISALIPSLDNNKNIDNWKDLLQKLQSTQINLVLYVEPDFIETLNKIINPSKHIIRPMDVALLKSDLWLNEDFFSLGSDLGINPDELMITLIHLRSLGWLNDESIFNPFKSESFIWIDPTLLDEINPYYIHNERGLSLMEPLLEKMLILINPNSDIKEAISCKLFGGNISVLSKINNAYWTSYSRSLKNGNMPSFSSIIGDIYLNMPEYFSRFLMQSNGLEGALFDAIDKDTVLLETTYIKTYE